MPVYNKLVRDRIPEIIEMSGKSFTTRILEDDDYLIEIIELPPLSLRLEVGDS